MESNRYLIVHKDPIEKDKKNGGEWRVEIYLNPAQAVHDFVRMGGLVDKNIIFTQEQPVSIRIANATINFDEPKKDEPKVEEAK